MLRSRPLVPPAAGFLAGIAAARAADAPWLLAAAAAAALAAALALARRRAPPLAALLGAALGAARQEVAELRDPLPLSDRVEGIVAGPPRLYRTLDEPDGAPPARASFVVGRVQVRAFGRDVPLIGGERVRVRGPMKRPRRATNPGQFDYGAWLQRQGIDAVMNLEDLEILEGPPAWSRARAGVRSLFDRGMRPDVSAFCAAIVLGRREPLPDDLVRNFQRTGTAHVLALSGQNLVIVLAGFWTLLTLLGVTGRAQAFLLLGILGGYVLLTGLEVSVIRSFLMIAAFLVADLAWRRRDALSALAAAAIVLTAADPAQVTDVGFQLSFAAVLGLSLAAPAFHALPAPGGWAWDRLRRALAASLAAWLATAPIVLETFNLLTPVTVAANLAIVPLMTLEFGLGLAHLALAPLGLGGLTGTAAGATFDLLRAVSGFLGSLPFSHAYGPSPGPALLAVYYAALGAWTLWCRRSPSPWKAVAAAALVLPLGLTGPLRHRAPEGVLFAALDVGRGSCAYLEWPDGRNLMVDCGSLDVRDPGASIAARYLWHRGLRRLDTLVLTHPDADHVNGARSVLELLRVRRLVVTRAFEGFSWPPGIEVVVAERLHEPVRLDRMEILGPPAWEKFGRPVPPNETSVVLRAAGVLFTGDVQDRGVEELLTLPDLRARILVMPHHGKYFERHEEFVRRVAPETIVVSAPEGYYSPRVVGGLPVPALITGRDGAVEKLLK
jgi:competence protein ComEC